MRAIFLAFTAIFFYTVGADSGRKECETPKVKQSIQKMVDHKKPS